MSSSAYILLDRDAEPVSGTDWLAFCDAEGIVFSPNVGGQNVFNKVYDKSAVELTFGDMQREELVPKLANGHPDWSQAKPPTEARRIIVSTYFYGAAMPEVARLALQIWRRFGGSLEAADEIRALMVPLNEGAGVGEALELGPRGRPSSLAS